MHDHSQADLRRRAGSHAIHEPGEAPEGDPGARRSQRWRLGLSLALAAGYMVAEIIGGLWSGSLALLADAGHMASDVAALGLALFALWVSQRPPDSRRTFGHTRAEILAALAQGAGLLFVAALVVSEAFERLSTPPEIAAPALMAVAAGGLLVNGIALVLLHGGRSHSLNLRGAFLHVASDALGSVGALSAGFAVWRFGWLWADPAASLAIAALIVISALALVRDAIDVLMETAPAHLDVEEIRGALREAPGVSDVHDLHVWSIGSHEVSLSAHAVASEGAASSEILSRLHVLLLERFGISHATIQVEPRDWQAPGEAGCVEPCDGVPQQSAS